MEMGFNGVVKRWVDGDTVDVTCDLGFRVFSEQRFRLARIDTPERGQPGHAEATARANELAPVGSEVIVMCHGHDKYNRWIAEVDTPHNGVVNNVLLEENLAKPYK